MNWKNRSAYAFIKTRQGTAEQVWQRFHTWKNMIGAWVVTGEYDVIVWFDAKDWDTIHDCIATIKQWDEVENTKTHMVHHGYKNNTWWWEKPAGAWVMFKENHLDETTHHVPNWDWITSGTSIPGEWDYMAWIEAENYDELWNHLMQTKHSQWKTTAVLPLKSWWNTNWKQTWRNEFTQESNPDTPFIQHQY